MRPGHGVWYKTAKNLNVVAGHEKVKQFFLEVHLLDDSSTE